ncbi:MAG: acyl-CoA desaturase [Planctomycetia bacterium]
MHALDTWPAPQAGRQGVLPDSVRPYRVRWRYAVVIGLVHALACLALLPGLFSWTGVVACVLGVHLFGAGINLGYHRLLTHRSFRTPRWVEYTLASLAICSLEDTPVQWVAVHRMHHAHSDDVPDPHSPLVTFLWSHLGWLLMVNPGIDTLSFRERFAPDLLRDRFYFNLEKYGYLQVAIALAQVPVFFLLGFVVGWLTGGLAEGLRLGASVVVWGVFLRIVLVWHITWSVNSLSHLFGYRNYDTGDGSRNNWLVALLAVGEGWHNNHHADPTAASVQHRWWEVDISYCEIKLLEALGLARDIVKPRHLRAPALGKNFDAG